jgi:hypothetical protein
VKTPEQVEAEVQRIAGRGLLAAGTYLAGRMKDVLSVPAPRRRVTLKSGVRTWVATTKATPGAPPRKITGSFRAKVAVRQPTPERVQVGVYNDIRVRPFETWMRHPFLIPTFVAEKSNLVRIIGAEFGSRRTLA